MTSISRKFSGTGSVELMCTIIAFFLGSFFFTGNLRAQDEVEPWEIPQEYSSMKNPHKGDAALAKIGKTLYAKHCRSCHGPEGLGDGPKSGELETYPGDLTSTDYKKQPDGIKYYKSFIGRSEMPNFEKKILDEEDRWAVILYMETLK